MTRRRVLVLIVFGATLLGGWAVWQFRNAPSAEANVEACAACLPAGLTVSTEFSDSDQTISSRGDRRVITVRQKLVQLGAYCEKGVIYDRRGRQVFFHRMLEWGNPPVKYMELLENERQELQRLEAQGTVIRMWQTRVPI